MLTGRRSGFAAALATVALVATVPARANGRFPASNAVFESPADPTFLAVRVTFGLLVSRDAGRTFGVVCERAIGFSGTEDPTYVVTPRGTIVAGVFDGLRVSRDTGCSWATVTTKERGFVDVTMAKDGKVLALASIYERAGDAGSSLYRSVLLASSDDGASFVPEGPALDGTLLGESVEVAPSGEVFVSAVRGDGLPRKGVLLRAPTAAGPWTEFPVALEPKELAVYIAKIDGAGRIYLRTRAAPEFGSRLLVSDDRGAHFKVAHTANGPLLGFALSRDEKTVFAGGLGGLVRGTSGDLNLSKVASFEVQCLHATATSLLACSNEVGGFILGASKDEGAHFEARLHLRDLHGPPSCAEGTTVAAECPREWAKLKGELGLEDEPGAAPRDGGGRTLPAEPEARAVTPVFTPLRVALGVVAVALIVALVRRRR